MRAHAVVAMTFGFTVALGQACWQDRLVRQTALELRRLVDKVSETRETFVEVPKGTSATVPPLDPIACELWLDNPELLRSAWLEDPCLTSLDLPDFSSAATSYMVRLETQEDGRQATVVAFARRTCGDAWMQIVRVVYIAHPEGD